VRPSALAVLRLITSSTLVLCWMGEGGCQKLDLLPDRVYMAKSALSFPTMIVDANTPRDTCLPFGARKY